MPVPDFFFSLELSDRAAFDHMINDLNASILRHAGYAPDAAADIAATLRGALDQAAGAGGRRCDVRFAAHDGELRMAVACGGGEWRATRPLP